MLDQALGLFDDHVRNLHMTTGRLIKGRRHNFTAYGAFHLGHFFRPLVDEQNHQVHVRRIGDNSRCDILQQHGFTGLRRRHDQATLAFANWRYHVDNARRKVLGAAVALLKLQALFREQRCQVLKQDLGARVFRCIMIDLADLQQREIAFAVFWRTNQAGNGIACAQGETPDLARADIDIIRAGKVGAIGRAQEAEAVLEDFERPFTVNVFAGLRVRLEDGENDVLLA